MIFAVGPLSAFPPTIGETATTGIDDDSMNDLISLIERIGSMLKYGFEGQTIMALKPLSFITVLSSGEMEASVLPLKEMFLIQGSD